MQAGRPRFVVAAAQGRVLDRQTGLTWEQAPGSESVPWSVAAGKGTPEGWRLPSASELLLLLSGLPRDHPFPAPSPGTLFWSASASPFSARGQVRAIGCHAGPLYVVRLVDRQERARVWRVRDRA
jgi:hypothetical protein